MSTRLDLPRHREGRSEVTMGPCLLQDQSCLWPMRVGDKEDMWLLLCPASIEHRLIYMGNSMFLIPGVGTTLLRSLQASESYALGPSPTHGMCPHSSCLLFYCPFLVFSTKFLFYFCEDKLLSVLFFTWTLFLTHILFLTWITLELCSCRNKVKDRDSQDNGQKKKVYQENQKAKKWTQRMYSKHWVQVRTKFTTSGKVRLRLTRVAEFTLDPEVTILMGLTIHTTEC